MLQSVHPDIKRVALLGWRVYPCGRNTKSARFANPGERATCDLDLIERWTNEYPPSNWRVVMEGSGIWGLDLDVPSESHSDDGVAVMARWVEEHGALPLRPTTRSGGGGIGMFFKHEGEPISGQTGYPVGGVDPRRGKLSVTIPPSIHIKTRQPYQWLVKPWEVDAPKAPNLTVS